jgi:hypothetical protein
MFCAFSVDDMNYLRLTAKRLAASKTGFIAFHKAA